MALLYSIQIFVVIALQTLLYFTFFPPETTKGMPTIETPQLLFYTGVLLLVLAVQWSFLRPYRHGRYIPPFFRWIKNKNSPRLTPMQRTILALGPVILFLSYLFFHSWSLQGSSVRLLWLFTGFFLVRAAFEEMIFRGYLFRVLLKRHRQSIFWVILGQAALFAVMHNLNPDTNLIRLANIFLGGVLLGMTAMRSFSAATLFHFAWNFLPGFLLGATVSGYQFETSLFKADQPLTAWEDNPVSLAVFGVTILLFYLYERKQQESIP